MSDSIELTRLGSHPGDPFPSTQQALESPNGLLAWGGDLEPERILNAYRAGIFPWYAEGQPLLWWSPAPRCVLFPGDVYVSRRTRRRFNSGRFRISADTAFNAVVRACSEPRSGEDGTWITSDMVTAYTRLHHLGHAHSVEVWEGRELAGGIYGLSIGRVFFGESMFSRATDASKIALIALCRHLQEQGIDLLDCQVGNPHLYRMGASDMDRDAFEQHLARRVGEPTGRGPWTAGFDAGARW